ILAHSPIAAQQFSCLGSGLFPCVRQKCDDLAVTHDCLEQSLVHFHDPNVLACERYNRLRLCHVLLQVRDNTIPAVPRDAPYAARSSEPSYWPYYLAVGNALTTRSVVVDHAVLGDG